MCVVVCLAGVSIELKQIDCHETSFIHIIMCHRMFMLRFILFGTKPKPPKNIIQSRSFDLIRYLSLFEVMLLL